MSNKLLDENITKKEKQIEWNNKHIANLRAEINLLEGRNDLLLAEIETLRQMREKNGL